MDPPPKAPDAQARLYFHLGYVYQRYVYQRCVYQRYVYQKKEPQNLDRAVALDPAGLNRDRRGVVYAELGRLEDAIADFEALLAWLMGVQRLELEERRNS
ncbi:MAG: hypothetical protein MAG451_02765 [Anaerolineales bacterium]|nr:hypothetical protein [Anaerolineales bacterium]